MGAVIAWIISRSQSLAKLSEQKALLSAATEKIAALETSLKEAIDKNRAGEYSLNNALQTKASLLKETELLSASVKTLNESLRAKEETIKGHQASITDALQIKASAETALSGLQENLRTMQQREALLVEDINSLTAQLNLAREDNARLDATYKATVKTIAEQQQFIAEAQLHLKDAFGALSADALQTNNASFVELAKAKLEEKVTEAKGELEKKEQAIGELVKPLGESLKTMDTRLQELEVKRVKAYADIWNYLDTVKLTTEGLKKETNNLVGALKTSHSRGRYGELALRRLVEHAGMFEHCDFEEQVSVEGDSGRLVPDMVIKLPGNKMLIVDSKAPLAAYLRMFETDNPEEQRQLLEQHVAAVKDHLKKLSAKAYWNQFASAPDFVIMYMQIESSYGVALQAYPAMIEDAMKSRIIIATPTVLLSILLGVGYSWNQLKTMENIEEIRDAAVELHDRSTTLIEHISSLGKSLHSSVAHFNKTVGSLEGNFMPQARKINMLSQAYTKKQVPEIIPIESSIRTVAIPLKKPGDDGMATVIEEQHN